ncbi:purine nucleosidase [Halopolyspora algeriensis]|uniref:Purine nucleosidase n=1 Tax=Halopolyspora algeriensis TaxID=1500506 RepID=A0A368VJ32_9ACTN|nr:nucleoside hydrolase [Halopolyspora algeriensis]RCW40224.1 purine nucleosidase [Halopolyspora algeriensis]TQM46295.1 purine nucleosidase [Halopolyspora algeriensis]
MSKKILIDCDPGIDDALAIALAHGSPEVEVVGLTSVGGNVGLEHTTGNALCLSEFYGMDVPVARGADRPLLRAPREASDVHGPNGLGNVLLPAAAGKPLDRHAVEFIIDTLAASPGEISLTAVGPLTNIALALRKEPRITQWAKELVIMGGSYTRGNNTPAAEFNIAADPEAAAAVFSAPWQPVMVGLDLTLQARATAAVRSRFAGLGRFERELLSPCLDFYGEAVQYREGDGPPIHDACAVAYVIDPGLITTVTARVDVETHGRFTSGMTVTDFTGDSGPHNTLVATGLRHEAFWDLLTDAYTRVADPLG